MSELAIIKETDERAIQRDETIKKIKGDVFDCMEELIDLMIKQVSSTKENQAVSVSVALKFNKAGECEYFVKPRTSFAGCTIKRMAQLNGGQLNLFGAE